MTRLTSLRGAILAVSLGLALQAHADSFTSSASSAGSASSGSVSDSLSGSSKSSSGGDKVAAGDYRIIDVAQTPGRAGSARIAMQGDKPEQRIVLDLPQTVVDKQGLGRGDLVNVQHREYGLAFARGESRQAFYLVIADDVYDELKARRVTI